MDAATLAACVENQRNARTWHEKSRTWCEAFDLEIRIFVRGACRQFAIDDQEVAAKLYRADRLLRGMEG